MPQTNCLVVNAPGMSKALLMDLLGGLALADHRIEVAAEKRGSNLESDPATVALIGAAGMAVVELIKSVTQAFLERKKAQQANPASPPAVHVTVQLTLGGKRTATVTEAAQLDHALEAVPSDYAEIARIQIS